MKDYIIILDFVPLQLNLKIMYIIYFYIKDLNLLNNLIFNSAGLFKSEPPSTNETHLIARDRNWMIFSAPHHNNVSKNKLNQTVTSSSPR